MIGSAISTPVHRPASAFINDLLVRIAVSLQLTPTQYRAAVQHYESVADG